LFSLLLYLDVIFFVGLNQPSDAWYAARMKKVLGIDLTADTDPVLAYLDYLEGGGGRYGFNA
jgi:hypothetical protein